MTASNRFMVRQLVRTPELGSEDRIDFKEGVNVVVGPPNSGKTKWFQMLDYVLGNDGVADDVLGEDVAEKYETVTARLLVAGEEIEVQRRWKEAGAKGKVFLHGGFMLVKDFLHDLLSRLGIPILHYPQGNPLGQRKWPELGWRSLYRHMYRRQTMWGDIADQQPESEQHASILQFVGLAEKLFSDDYGKLVEKQKKIIELQGSKDQYMAILTDVSKQLLTTDELGVGLSPQSIEAARQRTQAEVTVLNERREQMLASLTQEVAMLGTQTTDSPSSFDELAERLSKLQLHQDDLLAAQKRAMARLSEMQSYQNSLHEELGRMERAKKAGTVLADLKVTHCPACDRPIETAPNNDSCHVCHRPFGASKPGLSRPDRIEFELEQLRASSTEAKEIVDSLQAESNRLAAELAAGQSQMVTVRSMLRPIQSAAAAVLPPEIAVIDMQIGQFQERLAQIERVSNSLSYRDVLSKQIDTILAEVGSLESDVANQSAALDFEKASDWLADGMNSYLNSIHKKQPTSWTQKEVRVRLDEKRFRFLIGDRRWNSQLGGTLSLYFLIAYHYSLMCLVTRAGCHFPGFVALDFQAELEDGSSVADKENFVLEPFIELLASNEFLGCQVIAAGAAFENLVGAHRIEFKKIWK
jgi:energy-coupling factor transporter ATP-binding protein EcfA2